MRKAQWEDSSKNPDWTDLETLMRAIGSLNSGAVAVIVSPAGTGFGGGVDVAASILLDVLPGSSLPASVAVSKRWPCGTHKTLSAHAFSLLYELDYEISKTYKTEELWK